MTEQLETPAPHPVLDFARRGRGRLEHLHSAASRPVWAMSVSELRESLVELSVMVNQLEALRLQVLAEAERVGTVAEPGDRSVADWVARHTHQHRGAVKADLKLALTLDADHQRLAAAMGAGQVNPPQARVIQRSLELLPATGEFATTPAQRAEAETHLVDLAKTHDPQALEILGKRIYCVIAPEAADAYEGRLLEAEEARAARKVTLETWTDHQGITHGHFRIPKLHGAILQKALAAITSPARTTSEEPAPRDTRPVPVKRGEALCELLERLRATDLPTAAGGDATLVVTITEAHLHTALERAGVATLDTGQRTSAAEARRFACAHRILPAVLNARSQVMDLGRSQRLHTKAQRLAMSIRDGGCTAEHCDIPAAMCHAHHDNPWGTDGEPHSRTAACCADPTTAASTTPPPPTPSPPTARSGSTAGPR